MFTSDLLRIVADFVQCGQLRSVCRLWRTMLTNHCLRYRCYSLSDLPQLLPHLLSNAGNVEHLTVEAGPETEDLVLGSLAWGVVPRGWLRSLSLHIALDEPLNQQGSKALRHILDRTLCSPRLESLVLCVPNRTSELTEPGAFRGRMGLWRWLAERGARAPLSQLRRLVLNVNVERMLDANSLFHWLVTNVLAVPRLVHVELTLHAVAEVASRFAVFGIPQTPVPSPVIAERSIAVNVANQRLDGQHLAALWHGLLGAPGVAHLAFAVGGNLIPNGLPRSQPAQGLRTVHLCLAGTRLVASGFVVTALVPMGVLALPHIEELVVDAAANNIGDMALPVGSDDARWIPFSRNLRTLVVNLSDNPLSAVARNIADGWVRAAPMTLGIQRCEISVSTDWHAGCPV